MGAGLILVLLTEVKLNFLGQGFKLSDETEILLAVSWRITRCLHCNVQLGMQNRCLSEHLKMRVPRAKAGIHKGVASEPLCAPSAQELQIKSKDEVFSSSNPLRRGKNNNRD